MSQPKILVDPHPLLDHVEAVLEVVEHLALGRQVRAILAESPLDVPGGEHGMRLVESHVRVGVDPHAADALPSVDQDDLLVARQVSAGDEQGVESGDAGADDADIAALDGDVGVADWMVRQWSSVTPFVRAVSRRVRDSDDRSSAGASRRRSVIDYATRPCRDLPGCRHGS